MGNIIYTLNEVFVEQHMFAAEIRCIHQAIALGTLKIVFAGDLTVEEQIFHDQQCFLLC